MDPVSLTAISIGSTVAAGGVGALGSIFSGKAASNMYNYQAGIATQNAAIARQNANYEFAKGESEAQQLGMKTRYQIGQTKTIQAAGGTDVNRGSNVAVRTSEAEMGSLNQAVTRNTAARKSYGYEVEAASQDAQAGMDRVAASTSKTSSYYNAASSILGAGGSVADKWMKAADKGVPGFKYGGFSSGGGDQDSTIGIYT